MNYYKRNWDELRGDEYDYWGTSVWYFEVADDGYPTRQVEVYEHGQIVKYDEEHNEDSFGGLSQAALDLDEFKELEISKEEFEDAWNENV